MGCVVGWSCQPGLLLQSMLLLLLPPLLPAEDLKRRWNPDLYMVI
jgi:hypothetical protein